MDLSITCPSCHNSVNLIGAVSHQLADFQTLLLLPAMILTAVIAIRRSPVYLNGNILLSLCVTVLVVIFRR